MEILPGTEIMADIGSHHFVKGTGNDNVLVPQPSDDPHDVCQKPTLVSSCRLLC